MSFLLGALGSLATPLLGKAGSWIAKKTAPYLSKAANWLGGLFGGSKGKEMGQSSMGYMVDKALNTSYDAAHRFANSDFVQRRMPIVAPYIKEGAAEFRNRMRDGYSQILGGGPGPQVGMQSADVTMRDSVGGIEKNQ